MGLQRGEPPLTGPGTGGGYSGTSTYVYDGDSKRIKKTEGGITTVYPSKYYEKTGSEGTSNYYLGDRLVAVKGSDLKYIHQDHLGSSSVSSDGTTGAETSSNKYYPFGGSRSSSGTPPTDKKFTGQRLDGTGMYFYNSRYYDPEIGRFISPDPITHSQPLPIGMTVEALTVSYNGPWAKGGGFGPNTGSMPAVIDPQEHNRYGYVLNNPLKYRDPTGNQTVVGEVVVLIIGGAIVTVASYQVYVSQDKKDLAGAIDQGIDKAADTISDAVGGLVSWVGGLFGSSNNSSKNNNNQGKGGKGSGNGQNVSKGAKKADATGKPNSTYEQVDPKTGQLKSRTFYDANGQRAVSEHYGHPHYSKELQVYLNDHSEIYYYNEQGQFIGKQVVPLN